MKEKNIHAAVEADTAAIKLTEEEKALLAAAESDAADELEVRKSRRKPAESGAQQQSVAEPTKSQSTTERGPLTPAQYDDDGWGDIPVQMRG